MLQQPAPPFPADAATGMKRHGNADEIDTNQPGDNIIVRSPAMRSRRQERGDACRMGSASGGDGRRA